MLNRYGAMLIWLLLPAIVFNLIQPAPAYGSEEGINMLLLPGFEGHCKLGGVTPVQVVIEMGASDVDGQLTLEVSGKKYAHPVQLARNTRKGFQFDLPLSEAGAGFSASLTDGGRVLAKAAATPQVWPRNTVFVGLLSDTPEVLGNAGNINLSLYGSPKTQVIPLDGQMNYTTEELENFNLILLDNFETAQLSDESRTALTNWLSRGNCLLAGAGQYADKNLTGMLENLHGPVNIGAGMTVPVSKDLSQMAPQETGVIFEKYMTAHGLAKIAGHMDLPGQMGAAEKLYAVADNNLSPTGNTLFLFLSLLVLYLAAAGLGIYLSKERPWLFFALITGFCALFTMAAFWGRLQDADAASAAVKIHGAETRISALTGVYPVGDKKVSLALPGAGLVLGYGEVSGGDDLARELIFAGDSAHYAYSSHTEAEGENEAELNLAETDILTGTVKNPLSDTLYHGFMLVGDTVISLGDLRGREEVQVNYRLDHTLRTLGDYNYLDVIARSAHLSEGEQQLFEYYLNQMEPGNPEARIFGFAQDKSSARIDGREQAVKGTTLHVFQARIDKDGSEVYLPSGFIPPVPVSGEKASSQSKRESIPEQGGSITLAYPLPSKIQAEEITFYGISQTGSGRPEIFNRTQRTWKILDIDILQGDALTQASGQGPLLVRIKGDDRVIFPQIALKGNKEIEEKTNE